MGHVAKRTFLTQKTKGTEEVSVSLKPPFFGKRRILKSDKYIIFIILLLRMSYRNSLVAPDYQAATTQQIRIGWQ
jgi:hypothetical protein